MSRVSLTIENGVFVGYGFNTPAGFARSIAKYAEKHGECIGAGCFQYVYTVPGIEGVIKICQGDFLSVDYAVNFSRKHKDNPHVPKLIAYYGQFKNEDYDYNRGRTKCRYVYQSEALERVTGSLYKTVPRIQSSDFDRIERIIPDILKILDDEKAGAFTSVVRDLKCYLKEYAKKTGNNRMQIDLHAHNYMMRPGTGDIVINDPIAFSDEGKLFCKFYSPTVAQE